MNTRHIGIGVALAAVIGAAAWWHFGPAGPAQQQDAAQQGKDDTSVLVQTASVTRSSLAQTVSVFGEVAAGKPESLSFAQAGQLLRVPLVAGQQVRRGELLATLGSDPTAQSNYEQASNAVGFAQRELKRNEELLGLQLATASQVDAARKQLRDAQASLEAQRRLGGGQGISRLEAPFDAVVTALPVAQGERVQAGAAVVQLGRTDRLRVLLSLEPAQSARLAPGMPVKITPQQDGAPPITAPITEIQHMVDPKNQMVTGIVDLPAGKTPQLLVGTRMQAAIEAGRHEAWVVPRQAVLNDDAGAFLYQVANGHARRVAVRTLTENDKQYGVEGQLAANLPVVVLRNYELKDGMAVRMGSR
ncbi:efflux RND transporter periplasmic adaptor subunit [Massilia aerilata]|uniref:Efflux RND transporter periplasmic adaptor subunit n=1 Tax=Massilia aerilata TaxID=453817 RepID=A0ABW0S0R3_9BURK